VGDLALANMWLIAMLVVCVLGFLHEREKPKAAREFYDLAWPVILGGVLLFILVMGNTVWPH